MKEHYLLRLMNQHNVLIREIKLLKNHEAFVRRNIPGAVSANNEIVKNEMKKEEVKETLYKKASEIDISEITKILQS